MSEKKSESAPEKPTSEEPEIPYEAARDELVGIVTRLESGGISLAETMKLWERGETLRGRGLPGLTGVKTSSASPHSQ